MIVTNLLIKKCKLFMNLWICGSNGENWLFDIIYLHRRVKGTIHLGFSSCCVKTWNRLFLTTLPHEFEDWSLIWSIDIPISSFIFYQQPNFVLIQDSTYEFKKDEYSEAQNHGLIRDC